MSVVTVKFFSGLTPVNPTESPVLIIGQVKHLNAVNWSMIAPKLGSCVTQETWTSAVGCLNPNPVDSVSLHLNNATLAALPAKVSRHNTNSRAHSIAKIIKSAGPNEHIVLVCEAEDVYASGCAVGRCFPLYSRKTAGDAPSAHPKPTRNITVSVEFLVVEGDSVYPCELSSADIALLESSCEAIQLTAKIVDAPCNDMNTDIFLEEVRRVGKQLGVTVTIVRGEELRERGFGGIYGVGRAAEHPPALAVLSHTPPGAKKTVAWVGKGIVFDTGGLSIKTKTAMPGMKRDCGGAAAVLGAFVVAVRNGFTDNLHGLMCLAENSVGPLATRPDDIHTLYSGKTVEINNTDAEGRLVLADGVAYAAKDLKADIVLDICTLTGAQGIATGRYHASHLANSGDWEAAVSEAGRASGDLSFPAVYCPELQFPEFNSAVADMKNSVADRNNAQPSCAGLFIHANIGFDFPGIWLHVDMAAPGNAGERATGYGVALLNTLFGDSSKSQMLQRIAPQASLKIGNGHPSGGSEGKTKRMRME